MLGYKFVGPRGLCKKSWAVIDRPYSLGEAIVGALYERPRRGSIDPFCVRPQVLCRHHASDAIPGDLHQFFYLDPVRSHQRAFRDAVRDIAPIFKNQSDSLAGNPIFFDEQPSSPRAPPRFAASVGNYSILNTA